MMKSSQHNHPAESELLAHAEGLVGRKATLHPETASHINSCLVCREAIEGMRTSLSFVDHADSLEPSRELTNSIHMGSRKIRRELRARQTVHQLWVGGKRAAMVAGVILLAGILVQTGMDHADVPMQTDLNINQQPVQRTAEVFSLDSLRALTLEEEILFPAVISSNRPPQSEWERSQIRAVQAYDDDISEAMEALAANPALARAGQLIHKNRERKSQTLKDVYVRRN